MSVFRDERSAERLRRALSGQFGKEAQRDELARIAAESAPVPALFTRRQTTVIVAVAVLLFAAVVFLATAKPHPRAPGVAAHAT